MIDLHKFRKQKKYHQSDISKMTGLDQAVISKYENKKQVSEYLTQLLLEKIPELESYMIQDNEVNEEGIIYQKYDDEKTLLITSIKNLSESNKILAESISQAIELQKTLITKLKII